MYLLLSYRNGPVPGPVPDSIWNIHANVPLKCILPEASVNKCHMHGVASWLEIIMRVSWRVISHCFDQVGWENTREMDCLRD